MTKSSHPQGSVSGHATRARQARRGPSFSADERGAIMICGLFFSVFLVSVVYYVWAVIEVVRYREGVQDAVDMAAFSGAVVHAHGMNLLSLLNMVMAALLGVLVALRLVQLLCWFAIGTLYVVGFWTGGALYSFIPPLQTTQRVMKQAEKKLEKPIHKTIKIAHKVGEAVSKATPPAASARAFQLSRSAYSEYVLGAVPIPHSLALPVEDDEFKVLCKHAGEYAGKMAVFPFEFLIPDKIRGGFEKQLGKLAEAGSGWFCGDKNADPPSLSVDGKRKYPRPSSDLMDKCLDEDRPLPPAGEVDPVCRDAVMFELQSVPDAQGRCRLTQPACPESCPNPTVCPVTGADCNDDIDAKMRSEVRKVVDDCQPYETRLRKARQQCKPRSAGGPKHLKGVHWIERVERRTYAFDGNDYVLTAREDVGSPRVVANGEKDSGHPCGDDGEVGQGYEEGEGAACESTARCESGKQIAPCPRMPAAVGTSFRERVTVVDAMVQCIEEKALSKEQQAQEAEAFDVGPDGDRGALAPFKLRDGLWLGDDDFQLHTLAWGEGPNEAPVSGVRFAAWGQKTEAKSDLATLLMERFGFAQSEYFFRRGDDVLEMGSEADFLWRMGWRARLRPFRLGLQGLCLRAKALPGAKRWAKKLVDQCSKADSAFSQALSGKP